MATKKDANKTETKSTTTKKKPSTKTTAKETKTKAATAKAKEAISLPVDDIDDEPKLSIEERLDKLTDEVEKLAGELNIMKQFKNSAAASPIEKLYNEIDKMREQLFNCEDRLEELEYQVSEKEDY